MDSDKHSWRQGNHACRYTTMAYVCMQNMITKHGAPCLSLTGSRVHILVPAPPHELSESPGPLLLEGRPPPPLDDALHELLAVQALERPPQAQHLPQDQAEAVNVRLSVAWWRGVAFPARHAAAGGGRTDRQTRHTTTNKK